MLEESWVTTIRENLPELPDRKKERYLEEFKVTSYDASVIISEPTTSSFFESIAIDRDGKIAANLLINELFGRLNKKNLPFEENPITVNQMRELIELVQQNQISSKGTKDIFETIWETGGSPLNLVDKLGLRQVQDSDAFSEAVESVFSENPEQVKKIEINPKLVGWFVGQVMKKTKGKADPKLINQLIKEKLGKT